MALSFKPTIPLPPLGYLTGVRPPLWEHQFPKGCRDGAFDNLVKYKELSIQFGTFQIQKHDSLNIKRITPKLKVACATAPTPKIHDDLTVFQSSMVWVVWGKRAKNVEKNPSDVTYCYFYNKNRFYICFNSREEPSFNEFSLQTSLRGCLSGDHCITFDHV